LATDLVPERDVEVTRASLHASGRGVGYTKSPLAYLFERVACPAAVRVATSLRGLTDMTR
jgi:hypothetical protein